MGRSDADSVKRTDTERLWDWLKTQKYVKTSQVLKWGVDNFSNRANRNCQAFAEKNPDKLRRLTEEEKLKSFGFIKEDVWMVL